MLPGSQRAVFSLSPHMVEGDGMGALSNLFYKGTNSIHESSILMT